MTWALVILITTASGSVQSITIPQASEAHCIESRARLQADAPEWRLICGAMTSRGVSM